MPKWRRVKRCTTAPPRPARRCIGDLHLSPLVGGGRRRGRGAVILGLLSLGLLLRLRFVHDRRCCWRVPLARPRRRWQRGRLFRPDVSQRLRRRENDDIDRRDFRRRRGCRCRRGFHAGARQSNDHWQKQRERDGMNNAGIKQEHRHVASSLGHGSQEWKLQIARGRRFESPYLSRRTFRKLSALHDDSRRRSRLALALLERGNRAGRDRAESFRRG